jgi:hypothetical protein
VNAVRAPAPRRISAVAAVAGIVLAATLAVVWMRLTHLDVESYIVDGTPVTCTEALTAVPAPYDERGGRICWDEAAGVFMEYSVAPDEATALVRPLTDADPCVQRVVAYKGRWSRFVQVGAASPAGVHVLTDGARTPTTAGPRRSSRSG